MPPAPVCCVLLLLCRENNTGRFPRGLSLMLRSMSNWIYDKDPFQPMKWQDDLAQFKARLDRGEDVFGEAAFKCFILLCILVCQQSFAAPCLPPLRIRRAQHAPWPLAFIV